MHTVAQAHPTLDAALAYARRGWRVLRVRPNGKAPDIGERWPDKATTDEPTIRQWFENSPRANLGVACGHGLIVVDIDVKNGQDGEAAIAAWEAQHGALPPTYEVLTPSGGRHLYFQAGDLNGIKNRGNLFGEGSGVDIKADGGQVLAPPSTIGGKPYVCGRDGQVARIPPALLEAILKDAPQDAQQDAQQARRATPPHAADAMSALAKECAKVRATPEGNRNNTLNNAALKAGSRVGAGALDRHLAEAQLMEAALACGLPQAEARKTIASGLDAGEAHPRDLAHVGKRLPARTPRTAAEAPPEAPAEAPPQEADLLALAHRTDAGMAECFAMLHGDRLRFDWRRGRWLVFRPGLWWDADCQPDLRRMAIHTARARLAASARLADKDDRTELAKYALTCENRYRQNDFLELAKSQPPLADPGDGWDADPMLLGAANGVIDLRTGQLREGKPEDKITRHLPHEYDPDAKAPRWEAFLREVFADPDLINFVHRAAGYSITGKTTEQCFFTCYGEGANGKSKFFGALRHAIGPHATNTPFSTFDARNRQAIPSDLAALAGARFVTASESAPNLRLNEDRIKALTGGDPITARFLHCEFFTFVAECKIWLATNHRPEVGDDSHGFWRRVRLIPFTRKFGADADKNIAEKLAAEAQGILAWLVRGCRAWQAQGLEPVAQIADATKAWEDLADGLADFLTDCCTVAPQAVTPVSRLYAAYTEWADANGMKGRERLSSTAFGRRMGKRFNKTSKWMNGKTVRVYEGIGLLAEGESLQV